MISLTILAVLVSIMIVSLLIVTGLAMVLAAPVWIVLGIILTDIIACVAIVRVVAKSFKDKRK